VTTLAGLAGSVGTNDGTGGAARFDAPAAVVMDKAGDLYVADVQSDRIRRGFIGNGSPVILDQWNRFGIQQRSLRFQFDGGGGAAAGGGCFVQFW